MITEHDLIEAIAECQGERNPNAQICIKLAAYLTIKRELYGQTEQAVAEFATPTYSYAADKPAAQVIDYDGDSDFARIIHGRDPDEVWPIIDELIGTIQIAVPRLYNSVMERLQA